MNNIIFIPNINKGGGSTRHEKYQFAVDSWTHWASNNNAEVVQLDTPLVDIDSMSITWQRYYLFRLMEESGVKYDQILMADADIVVHPDTPDFFKMTNDKYTGVVDNGCWEWTYRSIKLYQDLFPDMKLDRGKYINGGFQIVNKKHVQFFELIIEFYKNNYEVLLDKQRNFLGTDQTPINYLIQREKLEVTILPPTYNLGSLPSRNLLPIYNNMVDSLQPMYDQAWCYHFNAIPKNTLNRTAGYWIERAYKELYK